MSDSLRSVSDSQILTRFRDLARRDCVLEAQLLAHLAEIDRRRLHVREGYSSLFHYCVEALNFSESVAYLRIAVARRARELPVLIEALRRGDLHLTGARLLAPRLTAANAHELIAAARRKTKRQIEKLLADRLPRPDRPAQVRRLPQTEPPPLVAEPVARPAETSKPAPPPPAAQRARSEPLGGARYRVSFTLDEDSHEKLEELRAWMRHQIPDGDIAAILSRAIALLHGREHKRKSAETSSPRPRKPSSGSGSPSRHIPAAIRRAVWSRDGGRCTYRSPSGQRCGAREFLELDHAEPWARVRRHAVGNLRLRCRAHNQYAAGQAFGEAHMARFRKDPGAGTSSADRRETPRGRTGRTGRTGSGPSSTEATDTESTRAQPASPRGFARPPRGP